MDARCGVASVKASGTESEYSPLDVASRAGRERAALRRAVWRCDLLEARSGGLRWRACRLARGGVVGRRTSDRTSPRQRGLRTAGRERKRAHGLEERERTADRRRAASGRPARSSRRAIAPPQTHATPASDAPLPVLVLVSGPSWSADRPGPGPHGPATVLVLVREDRQRSDNRPNTDRIRTENGPRTDRLVCFWSATRRSASRTETKTENGLNTDRKRTKNIPHHTWILPVFGPGRGQDNIPPVRCAGHLPCGAGAEPARPTRNKERPETDGGKSDTPISHQIRKRPS